MHLPVPSRGGLDLFPSPGHTPAPVFPLSTDTGRPREKTNRLPHATQPACNQVQWFTRPSPDKRAQPNRKLDTAFHSLFDKYANKSRNASSLNPANNPAGINETGDAV